MNAATKIMRSWFVTSANVSESSGSGLICLRISDIAGPKARLSMKENAMTYDDFRTGELQGWDARANGYDAATAVATVQVVPDLLAAVRLMPEQRLLDVCCGPGYAAGAAAALGVIAHGIDFAPAMVQKARLRFPDLSFDEGDAEQLAFPDASFDVVVCNLGLFHVTAPQRAMSEAFRVLRPGGSYAFSQWCGPEESALYRMILGIVKRHADMSVAPAAPDAFALSNRDRAENMLSDVGFTEITVREVPSILRSPADSFFDFFMRFGVRIPLILDRQSEEVRAQIRKEFDREAGVFLDDNEIRIPMPSIVASGQKPGTAV